MALKTKNNRKKKQNGNQKQQTKSFSFIYMHIESSRNKTVLHSRIDLISINRKGCNASL